MVRTRLRRARQLLKERIEKLESDPSFAQRGDGGFETWAREIHEELH